MTQKQVAEQLRVNKSTVSAWFAVLDMFPEVTLVENEEDLEVSSGASEAIPPYTLSRLERLEKAVNQLTDTVNGLTTYLQGTTDPKKLSEQVKKFREAYEAAGLKRPVEEEIALKKVTAAADTEKKVVETIADAFDVKASKVLDSIDKKFDRLLKLFENFVRVKPTERTPGERERTLTELEERVKTAEAGLAEMPEEPEGRKIKFRVVTGEEYYPPEQEEE